MSDDMLISADLSFSTSGIIGQEVRLSPKYSKITPDNRQEYINLAIKYRYTFYVLITSDYWVYIE